MKEEKEKLTRRDFLTAGLVGGPGLALLASAPDLETAASRGEKGICVAMLNHWSYIGIGWQLGLESCALSVLDSLAMFDRPPHIKISINLDARAYELLAEKFPEVIQKLKTYLNAGKVELIGGTFSQPLGSFISGESNIRQIVSGRQVVRKALGYDMVTFVEEEEFAHPQLPQILRRAGYQYASLVSGASTAGRSSTAPKLEFNVFNWQAKDGTTIPSIPQNSLNQPDGVFHLMSKYLRTPQSHAVLAKLRELGKPLLATGLEIGLREVPYHFLAQPGDRHGEESERTYLGFSEEYAKLSADFPVEYVTFKEYFEKYGRQTKPTVYLNMDAWKKDVTVLGQGGDQLRVLDRKVEALLLGAERFDGIAHCLGGVAEEAGLEQAWRDLMTAQSHDAMLCEYTRWTGNVMPPMDRMEDFHNLAWGAIAYNHLDAAEKKGSAVLNNALNYIVDRIGWQADKQGQLGYVVFNPCGWERTGLATTGRIYLKERKGKDLLVKTSSGDIVPSQLIRWQKDNEGNLVVAEVAFLAEAVPSVGHRAYCLELTSRPVEPCATDLRTDEQRLELENDYLKIKLDASHGAVTSLFDKKRNHEMLDGQKGPFPTFRGRPNPNYPTRSHNPKTAQPPAIIPPQFDSLASKADIQWLEKGPVRARVRVRHEWPGLKFETYVTLEAQATEVEISSRMLASVPPAVDDWLDDYVTLLGPNEEGYWLSFAPSFEPVSVLRDFPFGIEPSQERVVHGLTLVDLQGQDDGLLVLHAGTQYFKRRHQGTVSNLLMRDWAWVWGYEPGLFGWPRYAEYRHALMPHAPNFANAARVRASAEFAQKLLTVPARSSGGKMPGHKSYIKVTPENVCLAAFRKKEGSGYELRVVETDGQAAQARVEFGFPIRTAVETNLLGSPVGAVSRQASQLRFTIQPYEIRTFELT